MIHNLLTAFLMCLGMFTVIPVPGKYWDDDLRRASMAFLPLVGLVVGLLWWAVAALARWILPHFLGTAVISAFPLAITGFIHLGGFLDTCEVLQSKLSREGRPKIRKDAHAGSFATVLMGLLLMFQFASCASMDKLFPLAMIPVLSRVGSTLSVLTLAPLNHSEDAGEKQTPAELVRIEKCAAAVALVLMLLFSGWGGLLAGAAVLGGYALCMRWCVKNLGGVSYDLDGFALTVSELCGLIVLSIV